MFALLHAGYGQRTQKRERRAFEEIAAFYGVSENSSSNWIIPGHRRFRFNR